MLGLRFSGYNFKVSILVAIGTIATAYGLAIIGSTIGQPSFYAFFNLTPDPTNPAYYHTSRMIAALNACYSAGAVAGCFTNAFICDILGRKRSIMIGCLLLILGGGLCSGAQNLGMFFAGRVVSGLGGGILGCAVPIYQAEVSTPETRGFMVCLTGVAFAWGYTLAGWMGYACVYYTNVAHATFAWRFPLAVQILFPLIVLACSGLLPYSPRWLLSKGRDDEALATLERLHSKKGDTDHVLAKEEYYLIKKQFAVDAALKIRPFELFRGKVNFKRTGTACLNMFFAQFVGAFVIANYGVVIYQNLGLSGTIPLLLNGIWTTITIGGNIFTALFLDRWGRRAFLLVGATGCLISVICETALTATFEKDTTNRAVGNAAVFFVFLFIIFWSGCMDATIFVYSSEVFPTYLRAQGTSIAVSCFYLASLVTLTAAPIAISAVGYKFYFVLILPTALVYIPCIYFYFPETNGRSLEEIGKSFGDENVAAQWYGLSEEEKRQIELEALQAKGIQHHVENSEKAV